jgi:hypothetical protein
MDEVQVKDVDEKTAKSLDFNEVLCRQIDRINIARTQGTKDFPRAVEALISNMAFHSKSDPKFKEEMESIDQAVNEQANTIAAGNPFKRLDPTQAEDLAWARASLKLDACIKVMGRAGFLGLRQVEFEEE